VNAHAPLSVAVSYPGECATPLQMRLLADEYREAALTLRNHVRSRSPLSQAPHRLVVLQAIVLYLNAFLLYRGVSAEEVRGLQHNLAKRPRNLGPR
jgi:hypothetical protein